VATLPCYTCLSPCERFCIKVLDFVITEQSKEGTPSSCFEDLGSSSCGFAYIDTINEKGNAHYCLFEPSWLIS
jgi:hypothetical protein